MAKKITKKQENVLIALHGGATNISDLCKKSGLPESEVVKALDELKQAGFVEGPPSFAEQCAAVLKEMDDTLKPIDRGYQEAIILVASVIAKADEKFLADNLGYDLEFVQVVGNRLRNSKIWVGDKVREDVLQQWETSSVSFMVDVNVASGIFRIIGGEGENRQIELTAEGLKEGARIMKSVGEK